MNIPREAIVCSGRHLAAANESPWARSRQASAASARAEFEGGAEWSRQPRQKMCQLGHRRNQVQPQAEPGRTALSFDDIPLVMRVEALVLSCGSRNTPSMS